ncbi:hypothetical protein [Solicola gregarius]|uniref:Uncharacterized protein n=1 Tax=Solicola gregarius TaxID=2908642 RepID=A0AA46YKH9_9ACTN|nr:hypothetical protein [Solicola gregarius]UYM03988.1 hypothetical protein L0C25_15715 [Solicola gregarius]
MRINDKSLHKIERELGRDGVWISPGLRSKFSPRVERLIEKAVAEHRPPIHVALIKVPADHPRFHGNVEQLFASMRKHVDPHGTYIGIEGTGNLQVAAYAFGRAPDPFYATESAKLRHPNGVADQVVDTARLVAGGDARTVYKRLNKPDRDGQHNGNREQGTEAAGENTPAPDTGTTTSGQGTDSTTEDSGAGITMGIGVVVVLALVAAGVALLARRRRSGDPSGSSGSASRFEVPVPNLGATLATERRRREKRARRALTALGARIEESTSLRADDAWQQAVEHHTIARRMLDGPHSSADTVGVIVLAARGDSALDAAVAGREWEPTRPCYLNPLHGDSTRTVSWRGAAAGVDVPACATCADTIDAGRMPDDVLDFPYDGRPRHYFALEIEPWASTGYGALEPDLLGRLKSRRG